VVEFPEDCYQGDYIVELAKNLKDRNGSLLSDYTEEGALEVCAKYAAKEILFGIQADLGSFGVHFDNWFSEQDLYDSGKVDDAIKSGQSRNIIYEKDGALWFKTAAFGEMDLPNNSEKIQCM